MKLKFWPRLPRITIKVHPDYFIFQMDEHELRLETIAYIEGHGKSIKPISLGVKAGAPEAGARWVYLFRKNQDIRREDRPKLLGWFIEFGVGRCVIEAKKSNPTFMLRPIITINGIETLDELFNGYQHALLVDAALSTAAKVIISEG